MSLQHIRLAAAAAVAVAAAIHPVQAQTIDQSAPGAAYSFEIRPFVGAYIPTGDQSDVLKSAVLTGAQLSYAIIPNLAVTGSFAWSPTKDKITTGDHTVDLLQYDVGVEGRLPLQAGTGAWTISPFVGAGLGGRTYSERDLDAGSRTTFDGYGALGADFWAGRYGFRIEGRDYVSGFKGLTGDDAVPSETRNDIGLFGTVTIRF
jgi:hypothetical protein